MFEQEVADPAFQAVHSRLFGLAYRMLSSRAEARTWCRMSTFGGTKLTEVRSRIPKRGW
jgi:hypothetical protein